ncbi:Pinin like [Actinidia chinensis var. chinensis]|uniref:Pinin like n=1 Tax=Actinidia chinensis var. chinensis TaxID=1590841 RepID=A0A2R6R6M6_ACTCC|nr:Pinin like [Actinidia chinensis var. chinensis]
MEAKEFSLPSDVEEAVSEPEPEDLTDLPGGPEPNPYDALDPEEGAANPLSDGLLSGELVASQEQLPLLQVGVRMVVVRVTRRLAPREYWAHTRLIHRHTRIHNREKSEVWEEGEPEDIYREVGS